MATVGVNLSKWHCSPRSPGPKPLSRCQPSPKLFCYTPHGGAFTSTVNCQSAPFLLPLHSSSTRLGASSAHGEKPVTKRSRVPERCVCLVPDFTVSPALLPQHLLGLISRCWLSLELCARSVRLFCPRQGVASSYCQAGVWLGCSGHHTS